MTAKMVDGIFNEGERRLAIARFIYTAETDALERAATLAENDDIAAKIRALKGCPA